MKLIAKKPCFFDRQYYIGDEIPESVVLDPKKQERLGVIAIANTEGSVAPVENSGAIYTQEQFDEVLAAKLAEKVAEIEAQQPQEQPKTVDAISIPISTDNGGFEANVSVSAVTTALAIMQKNADDASEAIKSVDDDDVLMIINAADSRKSVKNATNKRHEEIHAEGGDADGKEL